MDPVPMDTVAGIVFPVQECWVPVEDWSAEDVARLRGIYEPLAESVRDLVDAAIRTEADAETVAAVKRDVDAVVARLRERQIDGAFGARNTASGQSLAWGNAVIGIRNALAPPVRTRRDEQSGRVSADFRLGAAYEGPPGHVHGGVSALILDHLLGEAASPDGKPRFTGSITVRYACAPPLSDRCGRKRSAPGPRASKPTAPAISRTPRASPWSRGCFHRAALAARLMLQGPQERTCDGEGDRRIAVGECRRRARGAIVRPVAAELLTLDLPGVTVNVRDAPVRESLMTLTTLDPPVVALVSLWADQHYGGTGSSGPRSAGGRGRLAGRVPGHRIGADGAAGLTAGQRVAGLANIALLRRPAQMDEPTWLTRWLSDHTPVAIATQSTFWLRAELWVRPLTADAPPVSAIVEEMFPIEAVGSLHAFFGTSDDADLAERMGRMIASTAAFGANENIDTIGTGRYVFRSPFGDRPT